MKRILIAAAHPDDELIGPGGTIARHVREGDEVYALILGQGQASRTGNGGDALKGLLEELQADSISAAKVLGIKDVVFRSFPDNAFDSVPLLEITKEVESVIEELEPSVIYTHHGGDLNVDHRCTLQAVMTAARPMEGCPVREIYSFPTLSSTEWVFNQSSGGLYPFTPNVFVAITGGDLLKKKEALSCYRSEIRDFPHPRSLKAMEAEAVKWGGVSGNELAEAFSCVYIKI